MAVALPATDKAQDHYKATNAIADVLGGIGTQQALIYPSVATDLHSYNLALSPEVADEILAPFEAWQFEVLSHQSSLEGALMTRSGYFRVEVSARSDAIYADGSIRWRPASPQELFELQCAIRRAHAPQASNLAA